MFVYYLFIIYHVPKSRFNTACIIKQSFFWWWYGVLNKRNIDRFCFLEMGSLVGCAPTTVKLLSHWKKLMCIKDRLNDKACSLVQWLHTLKKLHLSCSMASLERAVCKVNIILNQYKLKCTNKNYRIQPVSTPFEFVPFEFNPLFWVHSLSSIERNLIWKHINNYLVIIIR